MTLIWYARMVAAMTKTTMAHGRQGFSRSRRGVGRWLEFGWSRGAASSSILGWSRGASSSTTILQLDKYSFGYLYLAVSWVSEMITLGEKILSVQCLTADYTCCTPPLQVRDCCQRFWAIWGQITTKYMYCCLIPNWSFVKANLLSDCQSIIVAALLISPLLSKKVRKLNLINI